MTEKSTTELFNLLIRKGTLKQQVYGNAREAFTMIREGIEEMIAEYNTSYGEKEKKVPFELVNAGDFEVHLKFAGDVLIFMMHTNVFEFSRDHQVMKTAYIREDKERSYCGMIHVYNFLADSFKYNRMNDIGYMIGRMFVNKDMSYFIEGKRELGMLYPNFGNEVFNKDSAMGLVRSAIEYTINFDLLTPPYEAHVQVSLAAVKSLMDSHAIKTGKRLGFKFHADPE